EGFERLPRSAVAFAQRFQRNERSDCAKGAVVTSAGRLRVDMRSRNDRLAFVAPFEHPPDIADSVAMDPQARFIAPGGILVGRGYPGGRVDRPGDAAGADAAKGGELHDVAIDKLRIDVDPALVPFSFASSGHGVISGQCRTAVR